MDQGAEGVAGAAGGLGFFAGVDAGEGFVVADLPLGDGREVGRSRLHGGRWFGIFLFLFLFLFLPVRGEDE